VPLIVAMLTLALGCANDSTAPTRARAETPRSAVTRFALELGDTLLDGPFEIGARAGDRLYLAHGSTLRAYRLSPGEAPQEIARERFVERPGPMSYAPFDLVAGDDGLVVESDSHIVLFDRALEPRALRDFNVFAAELDGTTLVTAGPRGVATWRCADRTPCSEAFSAPATEAPYDLAIADHIAYAIEGGEEIRAVSLSNRGRSLSLPLAGARRLVTLGARVVVHDDSGLLHVIENTGTELRVAQTLGLFPAHRLRAGEGRVWLVSDEGRVALVVFDDQGRATVAVDTHKGWGLSDVVDDGAEVLGIGARGVRRLQVIRTRLVPRA
jgi:hypothetical protein